MGSFTITCPNPECQSNDCFVEAGYDKYVVLACKECQTQEEIFPQNDISIKYEKKFKEN